MSSSPQAEPRRGRAVTLRTKLVAGMVVVLVLLCAGFGVATELALSDHLVKQLDDRLESAQDSRPGGFFNDNATPPPISPGTIDDSDCNRAFGFQPDSSLFAVVSNGSVKTAAARDGFEDCRVFDTADTPGLDQLSHLVVGARPTSVTIDGRDYRVAARAGFDGDVLITGLSMETVSGTQSRLALILVLGSVVVVLVGGAVVYWIVRRSVRPLERVAETARAVTELPLSSGEVDLSLRVPDADTDPRTEIGQVGSALNQMLGHVSDALESRHHSETRVRQFVADASHELRTPLSAIRGYSELARRSDADRDTVVHALGRVESESERMTTLVEDLLLLARLDSGRPLAQEEVDLTLLLLDRVSDARMTGPDHRWQLELPDEPVTVTGDGARLQQVVANLLANARTHTPAGTVVTTSLSSDAAGATITVVDDGPGIPADLQPEIFGRFVRGDSSRSRQAGSTGLGLAIVSAVVAAHHGEVTVHSSPGRTEFTVRLPA